MPSGGRFGYKCIPAHTTCEVYHNQSGAEASITFATQVLDAENTVDINAAITDSATCLNCCSSLYTGTSSDTIGYYNAGTFKGLFRRGTTDTDPLYTRPGIFVSIEDGTPTVLQPANAANFIDAPYGGNEVILPGSTELSTVTTCGGACMALCAQPVYSCDACCVYFVTSVNVGCIDSNLGRKTIDPYFNASGVGGFSFDAGGEIGCNVVSTTCYFHACIQTCRQSETAETAAVPLCNWVINHYGTHITGDTSVANTPFACTYSRVCNCAQRSQFPIFAVDIGPSGSVVHGWTCTLSSSYCTTSATPFFGACHSLAAHPCGSKLNYQATSTFWQNICQLSNVTTLSKNCWFNVGGTPKSPYGVQRAATYGVFTWAFCNNNTDTGYFFGYPSGEKPLGHCCGAAGCSSTTGCGIGVWVNIGSKNICEYPIKYLSYDPNTSQTYLMSRSNFRNNCGIFRVDYDTLYAAHTASCGTGACTANVLPLPSLTWDTGFPDETDTPLNYFRKVADFPVDMTDPAYESTDGQMCVSCIYKYGPSNWSMQVYNHTNTEWDTFTTCDLIYWEKDDNISLFLGDSQKVYKCSDTCIVNFSDQFDKNVPEGTIIDYGVTSNAYERSGLVISNGDRLVIKNDGDYPISAQVWGFEG